MTEKDFLENYLWPSNDRLDRTYTHPVPNIEGLKKCGDFIVQCEHEDTFSTNIMTKYESDTLGVRLIDVSKNTQNKVTGAFIRLVGTMTLVKNGYPFLVFDAPISNVPLRTAEEKKEGLTTTVFVLLPQADTEQRRMVFDNLSEQAKESGISFMEREVSSRPDLQRTVWLAESKGANLDMIRMLRERAWSSYKRVIEQTKEKTPFDYRPFQEHMILYVAKREHLSFEEKGLSVPVEVQAAFFSVLVSGV